jgi:outer membrane immunogenic protein
MTAAMAASGAASAADLPRGPSPYYSNPAPANTFNWTGPYAGVNVGYEWGHVTGSPVDPRGLAGGGQVGYNWQSGQAVFGAETDIQFSGSDDTFAPWKFANPWFGTLRGRAGMTFSNILIYGTAGLAYGDVRGTAFGLDETKTQIGWTAGFGAEYGFTPNWSAKVEYLYMDLGSRGYTITGTTNGFETSLLRFGLNYHF